MKCLLLAGAALTALAIGSPAIAQTATGTQPEGTAAAQNKAQSDGIADIVVTAQRKQETSQRAPIAITAVGGEQLRNAGVVAPQALTTLVPALQVISGGTYPLYYIRGVGNFNGNPLSDSAVAVNYNDVYIGRPTSTYGLYYDLGRVEVLKGPQGTLYGRNATGGSINIIPNKPVLNEFGGSGSIEYGNYNQTRFDGMVNVPVSDNSAARLAMIVASHDGYLNSGNSDQDDVGGRLSYLMRPSSALTVYLSGDYYSQKGNGAGSVIVPGGIQNRTDVVSPQAGAFYATQPVGTAGRNFNPLSNTTRQNNEYWGLSAKIDYVGDWGSVTFIPAYRAANLDFVTNAPGFQITQKEHDHQFTSELRVASPDDKKLSWLVGGFYFKENIDVPQFVPNLQYNISFLNYRTGTESAAGFGRLTYAFTPTFKLTTSARFTHESKFLNGTDFGQNRFCVNLPTLLSTQAVSISGPCPGAAPFPSGLTAPVAAQTPFNPAFPYVGLNEIYGQTAIFQTGGLINTNSRLSNSRVTWHAGLDWQVTPSNLLYANYETGFKAGGFFFSADANTYKPEKIEAYTIGSKNRFLHNKIQLNIEAFYWRYSDQQISTLGVDSQQNFVFPTLNVGRANFKGIEVEGQFAPTRNTLLTADVQYLDAKYLSFVYQVPNQGPPVVGCPFSGLTGPTVTINCSGFRPPNAPEWTLNLGAQQTVPLRSGANVVMNVRGHYQSDTQVGILFLPETVQAGYWRADASITYNSADGHYFVGAFINNAFNKRYITATNQVGLATFSIAQLSDPRIYGVRAGFKF